LLIVQEGELVNGGLKVIVHAVAATLPTVTTIAGLLPTTLGEVPQDERVGEVELAEIPTLFALK
jgi:hypothetical protein